MSSSVYQALRSAGYCSSRIIEFATSLLDELCDENEAPIEPGPPLDAQTGFPTGEAFSEILDFEFSRARSGSHPLLGLVIVTVEAGDLRTAAQRFADENVVVAALRSRLRRCDAAGRTDAREFVLVLPQAGPRAIKSMAHDLHRALAAGPFSREAHLEVRYASVHPAMRHPSELLDSARRAPAVQDPPAPSARSTAHLLSRPVALALCGGAAMAAAHVGVLGALEQLDCKISGIGATSAGALVAAMYATGMDATAMLERFVSLSDSEVYDRIRSAYAATRSRARRAGLSRSRARLGFASTQEIAVADDSVLRALVEHFVPRDQPIESMRIRLAFCATDLIAGCTSYISHGSLHDGLMAACAVPGLFPPQRLGTKLLVDGSLAGELPVAAAASIAGGASVIGCYLDGPEVVPRSFENGVAVATRVAAVRQRELVQEQARSCERLLRIPVHDVGWMGFGKCEAAERAGRQTALRELTSAEDQASARIGTRSSPDPGPEVYAPWTPAQQFTPPVREPDPSPKKDSQKPSSKSTHQ